MGYGDQVLATGLARGARARGKRIAFGDGKRIIWNHGSDLVFRHNPNIAWLGSEQDADIEWVPYYKGHRIYNSLNKERTRWIWNYDFKPVPGEMFFDSNEWAFAEEIEPGFILIEPNLPWDKQVAENKDWGQEKYQAVADALIRDGYRVVQFALGARRLKGVTEIINAPDYRYALAALSRAALYIGPEGGLHHGAAAVGTKGVVLFGGFVPPQVTGYDLHANLTGGVEACGSILPCDHCRDAMARIGVDDVLRAAWDRLAVRQTLPIDDINPFDPTHRRIDRAPGFEAADKVPNEHIDGANHCVSLINGGKHIRPIAVCRADLVPEARRNDRSDRPFQRLDGFKRYWGHLLAGRRNIECLVFDRYKPGVQRGMSMEAS